MKKKTSEYIRIRIRMQNGETHKTSDKTEEENEDTRKLITANEK